MTTLGTAALLTAYATFVAACSAPDRGRLPPEPATAATPRRVEHAPAATGSYGVEPRVSPSPLEQAAIDATVAQLARGDRSPRVSAALVLAARDLALEAALDTPDPLAPARVRAALARGLSFDPAPVAHLVVADARSAPVALAQTIAPGAPGTHLGVGAALRGERAYLVLLIAQRAATLMPFPREVAVGTTSVMKGEVAAGLVHPSVHVTSPAGESRTVGARPGRGGREFAAPIRFDAVGRWRVEVVADGPRGPEVTALVTVSCGGAPLDDAVVADGPEPRSLHDAEAQVVGAVNAMRRKQNLPPLESWPALADVARRHSEAMLAAGVLAHRLPGSNGPGDRLRRGHVPFALVLENVAKGPTSLAAHRLAEESPAHRQNMLSRDVTRVGCGVARGTLPTGDHIVYLTELFVQPVENGADDRLTPEARVREALWRERARLGIAPFTSDPVLDDLAREAARRMLRDGDPAPQALAERALATGRKLAAADGFVATKASDPTRSHNIADPRLHRVGVGVAVGDDERFGAGLLWVAVVYTD